MNRFVSGIRSPRVSSSSLLKYDVTFRKKEGRRQKEKQKMGEQLLLWWNNLPYAEVLDRYVICIIPSKGGRWSSPSYDLIWFSSTFASTTSPSSRVNEFVYLLPVIGKRRINPPASNFTTVFPPCWKLYITPLNPTNFPMLFVGIVGVLVPVNT